jgi:hypothetical protein
MMILIMIMIMMKVICCVCLSVCKRMHAHVYVEAHVDVCLLADHRAGTFGHHLSMCKVAMSSTVVVTLQIFRGVCVVCMHLGR